MQFVNIVGQILRAHAKRLLAEALEGKLFEIIAGTLASIASIGLSILSIKKFFKKVNLNEDMSASDVTRSEKDSIKKAMKNMINRDQDIDQDLRRNGYTDEEIANDPGVARALANYRRQYCPDYYAPKAEQKAKGKGKKSKKNDPVRVDTDTDEKWFVVTDDDTNEMVFYHSITKEFTEAMCKKLYDKLVKMHWIHGPWNINPHKRDVVRLYGA